MRVFWVRHGESENNVLWDDVSGDRVEFHKRRAADPPLTPKGVEQAEVAARRLQRDAPDAQQIWVSYSLRALRTADAIHRAIPHADVHVKRDLHEQGGHYARCRETGDEVASPGISNQLVRAEFTRFKHLDERCEDGWWHRPVSESHEEAERRADVLIAGLQATAAAAGNESLVLIVVTHCKFFAILLDKLRALSIPDGTSGTASVDDRAAQPKQQGHHGAVRTVAVAHSPGTRIPNTAITCVEFPSSGVGCRILSEPCAAHLEEMVPSPKELH